MKGGAQVVSQRGRQVPIEAFRQVRVPGREREGKGQAGAAGSKRMEPGGTGGSGTRVACLGGKENGKKKKTGKERHPRSGSVALVVVVGLWSGVRD